MFEDLVASGPAPRAGSAAEVKAWARAAWNLPEDAVIVVSELRCHEPGCPPVETSIAVMHRGATVHHVKIHKPLAAICRNDLAGLGPAAPTG